MASSEEIKVETKGAQKPPLAPAVIGPKILTEVIGTCFLTFAIGMTAGKSPAVAPLAIGGTLIAMVYSGGHISGAHYNPTVSLAVFTRGLITVVELLIYIVAQFVGGFIGAGLAVAYVGQGDLGYPSFPSHSYSMRQACVAEFLWSLLLATVVLNVATAKATTNNSYYGLCIGFTVVAGAIAVGGVSGGAFNSAVGVALNAVKADSEAYKCWVYLVFPNVGGIVAGLLFRVTSPQDFSSKIVGDTAAALLMEFFTTFYLTLFVALGPLVPDLLNFGLGLFALTTALLFTGGATSGCHMNPAVSVGLCLRFMLEKGEEKEVFPPTKLVMYVLAQVSGALVAAGIGFALLIQDDADMTNIGFPNVPSDDTTKAFFAELQGAFILVYVVMNTATVRALEGNSFFGIAIGITITATALAIGPVSGGCLNPAVAMLTPIASMLKVNENTNVGSSWVYFIGCPLGGLLAAVIFRFQNLDEYDDEEQKRSDKPARRFSVMTDGYEDKAQQNKMMVTSGEAKRIKSLISSESFITGASA